MGQLRTRPRAYFAAAVLQDCGGRYTEWASDQAWVHLHQGGRLDTATGLYDFRNRAYSPTLGRWLQQDPAGYVDGAELYRYVGGSPVSFSDPSGLAATAPAGAGPLDAKSGQIELKLPVDGYGYKGVVEVYSAVDRGDRTQNVQYQFLGNKCKECHWVQFMATQALVYRNGFQNTDVVKGPIDRSSGSYALTEGDLAKRPAWTLDADPKGATPWYDDFGDHLRRDAEGKLMIRDRPYAGWERQKVAEDYKGDHNIDQVRVDDRIMAFLVCEGRAVLGLEWTARQTWVRGDKGWVFQAWTPVIDRKQTGQLRPSDSQMDLLKDRFRGTAFVKPEAP